MAKTELLAPAGSPEALDAAIGEGADAVYLGLKDFNARMRSANFTYSQFEGALRSLHRMGRKIYVTVNTVFEQREADRVYQLLKYLAALGPDGIIVQDFGIITLAREHFPSLKLFASTQMNVASARGVNLLSRHGFSRVVLARELSLLEIQDIRTNTNVELEVFVHGALCVSVSGLCLFSSYLGGKSANRGMCTQACRRFYTANGNDPAAREGGGSDGGYYFSPADLEHIGNIPALIRSGVNSFKIEGRMKSAEYVGAVVSAYRLVIDNMDAGESKLKEVVVGAQSILKNDFARSKTSYLLGATDAREGPAVSGEETPGFDWLNPKQSGGTGISLGTLLRVKGEGEEKRGLIPAGAPALSRGDSIRLHKADDSDRVSRKINTVEEEPGGGRWISIPEGFGPGDAVYLIQTKAMTKRYTPVIPRSLEGFNRVPGREKAPLPGLPPVKANHGGIPGGGAQAKGTGSRRGKKPGVQEDFPEGFYAAVSRIEDLYVLQSARPEKAILTYSRKTARQLLAGRDKALPFSPRDIILSLDPFFPQEKDEELAGDIPALMEKGYVRFIVNNLGHFSLFREGAVSAIENGQKPILAAGPWLYVFNGWAGDFVARNGAGYYVSPLENNRQNLERTFPREGVARGSRPGPRSRVFITIFIRPSLFRIRQDLGRVYGFENFSGNRGENFRMAPAPEGTLVYSGEPFSIVDKTPFLKEAGFSRFILDFSSGPLKKAEYRDIMSAVNRAAPLPGAGRFNWKNGFFRIP